MDAQQAKKTARQQALLVLTAIGIVFGDIGTSPLYALRECFHGSNAVSFTPEGLFGVLSLIFWSLMFVISFKYLVFVIRATNKGEGGVLSLMALAVYHQKRKWPFSLRPLVLIGLLGAALLVGDGMITPAISVLSAVEGLKLATPAFDNWVILIAVVILIGLFSIQKYGTTKIGSLFGPIVIIWFSTIGGLGLISILQTPEILKALNPYHALNFFIVYGENSLVIMGSVFLAVTGGEALYADVGHFGRKAIVRGWYFCALPGLVLNYFGQGALLLRNPATAENPFFYLAPSWFLYPLVALATMAAIIASQALISGLFSLAQQCIQLGYCPRLKIVHTSEQEIGQIYVPAMNWTLMVGTIVLVLEFGSSSALSGAYGLGISLIMVVTTVLASVVAWAKWGWSSWKTAGVLTVCMIFDLGFLAANSLKIDDGGWVSIVIAAVVYFLMTTWKRGREILISRLRQKAYPFAQLQKDILLNPPARVKGTAVFLVGDVEMTPPALMHNLRHNKVLHEKVIFLTVVSKEIPHVRESDRVEVKELAPTFFRVIAYYGFNDSPNIPALLNRCALANFGFRLEDPTYFLGREILSTGPTQSGELSFWRKKVFAVMAKNATVARSFFKLPQQDVIEVGMEIEI